MQLAHRRIYTGRVVHLDVDTVRYPDSTPVRSPPPVLVANCKRRSV